MLIIEFFLSWHCFCEFSDLRMICLPKRVWDWQKTPIAGILGVQRGMDYVYRIPGSTFRARPRITSGRRSRSLRNTLNLITPVSVKIASSSHDLLPEYRACSRFQAPSSKIPTQLLVLVLLCLSSQSLVYNLERQHSIANVRSVNNSSIAVGTDDFDHSFLR
jgi:hypothetical protein